LTKFVVTPPTANKLIARHGDGRLDLVPSHLGLIDVDLDFAANLGGSRFQHGSPRYLPLHSALADALGDPAFQSYDVVLLDCAPNFTMVTRTGIVASDHILIPAKPDYLSTLGIDYLRRKLSELIRDYNRMAGSNGAQINPTILGVVITMVQYASSGPIIATRNYIASPSALEVPVFQQMIRESKTLFATAGEEGIPALLTPNVNPTVQYELEELTSEFLAKIRI
jgi:chromosome partitioning protein